MPLFNRNRPVINQKRFATNLSNTPYRFTENVSTSVLKFENAQPNESDNQRIYNTITSTEGINVCNHPTISSGRIIRFFIGEPEKLEIPEGTETVGAEECIINPEQVLLENKNCVILYLFGHLVPKRRNSYGFEENPPVVTNEIPYSPPEGDIKPDDTDLPFQVMSVEQNLDDNKFLTVSSVNVIHRTGSSGVSVIKNEALEIDTWYNGNFELNNIGNNVGKGYLNDNNFEWEVGDRYNWTHGTVFFTSNIATETTSGGDIYEYSGDELVDFTTNGMEIKSESDENAIKLIAWKFFLHGIGTDTDPYKDSKHDFDFKPDDANLVSDLHINYFNRRYNKALFQNRLKQLEAGSGITLNKNSRGNIIIDKNI